MEDSLLRAHFKKYVRKKQKYSTSVDLKVQQRNFLKNGYCLYMSNPINSNEPFDLSLPTPGCYSDPEKAGMDSDAVFQGMTAHLFYTLGKLATSASPCLLYTSPSPRDKTVSRMPSSA